MEITAYVHPVRTFLPCTGAGRHINNTLLGISNNQDVKVTLLFSKQWLELDNKLPNNCPIKAIPFRTFPMPENRTERLWKLVGYPRMDKYIANSTDWLFAPMETYFPVAKCPVAITIYDIQAFESNLPWSQSWQHRWFRYKWGRWVRRAIDHSRIVFTISEFSKQRMVTLLGANPEKIVNIGCGVEPSFYNIATTPPETLPSPVDAPYVFMIGGLRQKKGGDHFLQVAKCLRQQNSDIQIVIAGSSDPDYVDAAKDYPNITLLGVVPDEDLPRLLRRSVCLLFLSLYEGFGIPALEAMATGVPAVVSNCASLPEVVGNAGIVVDPEQPQHIADTLIELATNSALRHSYVERGQKHVAGYTWSASVDRVLTALHQFA
ncbi:MAG: glycosyltransferase family 1 protein [Cyanobacteria bacterium P01_F01_bin.150]